MRAPQRARLNGAGPGCGMAMPHVLAGESPAWVEVSRQPSIETCRR
jgi:hypothetical protein